ncbi:MAG: Asp-tRNA(Asn)/Glu-tRNA(Gln) amidotransferase subunit GatC [Candidatus Microthrix sp.]|uniref:Aspartyl/glutamyl-tRNA(Asn/Gln) amidotransferase subunit C n=1 Tax=Candidatus Neomicrothrix subdominans TaxID=2954438 RepID=A0A936TE07_9ACTN|nr:Asp-tRNA(Asn)/Glu-tRNA(Gln) amidotransferase subunit GatC [Candidatus Microthrix sp.]MBK7166807.1 Asp-tRNA(Asn)/Glu-tRNA(Gln) amidotransferase subunit GatC [Candidatus Microthrix sp.]MBK9297913.1 Asp-tRNA(Asn)/Glu-tRNA(Gln) amidotransferase subunit GatC [Candidatus Microthrix subdominans]
MHQGAHPVTTDDGSPPITTDDVAKVAALARLELTPAELDTFTGQLADILDHAADLSAIDLDGVEPLGTPVPMENVLRADVPGDTLDRDEVLASAPASEDGKFKVTSILGEGA